MVPAAHGNGPPAAVVRFVWLIVVLPQLVRLPLPELFQEAEQPSVVPEHTLVAQATPEPILHVHAMPAAPGTGLPALVVRVAQLSIVVLLPQTVRVSTLQGQESAQHLAVNIIIHAI